MLANVYRFTAESFRFNVYLGSEAAAVRARGRWVEPLVSAWPAALVLADVASLHMGPGQATFGNRLRFCERPSG